jgi:hypothetical protein
MPESGKDREGGHLDRSVVTKVRIEATEFCLLGDQSLMIVTRALTLQIMSSVQQLVALLHELASGQTFEEGIHLQHPQQLALDHREDAGGLLALKERKKV